MDLINDWEDSHKIKSKNDQFTILMRKKLHVVEIAVH